jgi:cystathionine beta-lyase family protein involved in aluminum resistance
MAKVLQNYWHQTINIRSSENTTTVYTKNHTETYKIQIAENQNKNKILKAVRKERVGGEHLT